MATIGGTEIHKVNCTVYPEEVATEFSSGFRGSVEHFPGGEVLLAEVESIEAITEEEADDKGLVE